MFQFEAWKCNRSNSQTEFIENHNQINTNWRTINIINQTDKYISLQYLILNFELVFNAIILPCFKYKLNTIYVFSITFAIRKWLLFSYQMRIVFVDNSELYLTEK